MFQNTVSVTCTTASGAQVVVENDAFVECISVDEDGDGVLDDDDLCPGTAVPEAVVPSRRLGTNRWALVDDNAIFDTKAPKGKGPRRSYSTEDTAGCSCEQIIENLGLGKGHAKFGCSISAMDDWVAIAANDQ